MLKKIAAVLAFAILMATSSSGIEEQPQTIRIGLLTLYTDKPSIQIENTTLRLGYWLEDVFGEEAVFESAEGFAFVPFEGPKAISEAGFPACTDALEAAASLREKGIEAYPGSAAAGVWKVYLGGRGSDGAAVEEAISQAAALAGQVFYHIEDNGERVLMEGAAAGPMVLENGNMAAAIAPAAGAGNVLDLGSRQYRGSLEIARDGRPSVSAVNRLPLEEYLYGVLPGEIIPSWPEEALKAQAVAARSFAWHSAFVIPKFPNERYDLGDDVNSQVYKGYSVEHPATNKAVDATAGETVQYKGAVIPAYFFASSGGRTEDSENVWSATVPYLRSVPDLHEQDPERDPWVKTMTAEEIKAILAAKGAAVGQITDIQATGYTEAGRVASLKVIGTTGTYEIKKETIRYWLNLNSRKFQLIKEDFKPATTMEAVNSILRLEQVDYLDAYTVQGKDVVEKLAVQDQVLVVTADNIINQPMVAGAGGTYVFAGEGWGHGVGMSQSGAKGMALQGSSYKEILAHYYTGTAVKQL